MAEVTLWREMDCSQADSERWEHCSRRPQHPPAAKAEWVGRSDGGEESAAGRAERIMSGTIRSDDYLRPSEDVVAWVDRHLADTYTAKGAEIPPGERRWMLDNGALHSRYAGREIACWRTELGVIIFAVGAAEVSAFLRHFPVDRRPDVAIEYP